MNTKICKYCKESMLEDATKCPRCQSFQSKFRSPAFASLLALLVIPFALMPLYFTPDRNNIRYVDYKDKVTMDVLKKDTIERKDCNDCTLLNILVELTNDSDIEWEQAEFVVEFKASDGELLNIEKKSDYLLKLNPKSKSKSSIKVPLYQKYKNTEVEIRLEHLRRTWN